jgi:hypothetical protein
MRGVSGIDMVIVVVVVKMTEWLICMFKFCL